MNYDRIYNNDMLNGKGLRVVLFLTGCGHKCVGCYNESTWDCSNGKPFTDETKKTLLAMLESPHIDGLTLTGGDPLYKTNLDGVLDIVKTVSAMPDKNIWMWTGYTMEQAIKNPLRKEILQYVDFLMDGKYDQKKPTRKPFRGSDNQRLFELNKNSIEIKNIS
ncbi:anaerobic nucleotide reductase subunit [Pectobacterium phage POP12]|nr:anaerobic nucleotide reductase subunit [Pectobacterium phage POP12]